MDLPLAYCSLALTISQTRAHCTNNSLLDKLVNHYLQLVPFGATTACGLSVMVYPGMYTPILAHPISSWPPNSTESRVSFIKGQNNLTFVPTKTIVYIRAHNSNLFLKMGFSNFGFSNISPSNKKYQHIRK